MPEILIVDDSVSVRKALEITLRNQGLSSESAVSGEEALERLSAGGQYNLLMVDVIMPGMSGLELCARLGQDPRYAELPVVLMSGNVDDEVRSSAEAAGAAGVLRKPFKSEVLVPMVRDLLAQAQARAAVSDAAPAPLASESADPELGAVDGAALGALSDLLQTYEDHPRVRDVVILDRQGQPIRQTGNVLPEHIQTFARFFTTTAGVLGRQMLGEEIRDVTLRYGQHEMVFHSLPSHFVVVLMEGLPVQTPVLA